MFAPPLSLGTHLSTATFARRLKAHLVVSTEWHVLAAHLILLKAALLINIIIIIIITHRGMDGLGWVDLGAWLCTEVVYPSLTGRGVE